MIMKNFIKTKDKSTADMLIKFGYTLLKKDSGVWTFVNNGKKENFSDCKNMAFTNKLEV